MKIRTCAGCKKKMRDEYGVYRNKTFCGDSRCKEIIDSRKFDRNRRKKESKKAKGVLHRGVRSRVRNRILRRDNAECVFCGLRGPGNVQIHHIVPVSEGGKDIGENLITICSDDHNMVHLDMDRYEKFLLEIAIRRENEHSGREKL